MEMLFLVGLGPSQKKVKEICVEDGETILDVGFSESLGTLGILC